MKHGEGTRPLPAAQDPYLSNVYADMRLWSLIEACGPECEDGHCRCDSSTEGQA